MYKIETHLHTPDVSPCGVVDARTIVDRYAAAGYAALVVTDHYRLDVFRRLGLDPDSGEGMFDAFLEGYRKVKYYADQAGLVTLYGAELQFAENHNDYLLYGFPKELMEHPGEVCRMGVAAFSQLARQHGAMLIQAHPYRTGCVPIAPHLLDGVEAINRHDVHNNRNTLAMDFADRFSLRKTSGGDFHDPQDRCIAGLDAQWLPGSNEEFVKLLRSGQYRLLGQESC